MAQQCIPVPVLVLAITSCSELLSARTNCMRSVMIVDRRYSCKWQAVRVTDGWSGCDDCRTEAPRNSTAGVRHSGEKPFIARDGTFNASFVTLHATHCQAAVAYVSALTRHNNQGGSHTPSDRQPHIIRHKEGHEVLSSACRMDPPNRPQRRAAAGIADAVAAAR